MRCFNLIFLEQTFKAIKLHLFSLFKDATPVFLAENLNGMPFFLQKRDGLPLPWLGPYIISFLLFFPLWIENWPHEETLLQLFEIHEHIRANSNFAKTPISKWRVVVRRVSCSKTLDSSIRVEAGAWGWDYGRGWARGLSICPSVCLFGFFFLPFSTGMFQLISLTINLFFWNDQYWNFHSIPKRPWLGPYIIWFLLFFPLWIENDHPSVI